LFGFQVLLTAGILKGRKVTCYKGIYHALSLSPKIEKKEIEMDRF
jgi:putative intracellular protease/amidase